MTKKIPYICILSLLLSACSYSQKAEDIDGFINHQALINIDKKGTYKVSLSKNSNFSGKALLLGQFCSAHDFPYGFDEQFENSIHEVLDKVYETVELEVIVADVSENTKRDINIELNPAEVRIMCQPITEYSWNCVATTILSGAVNDYKKKKFEISVEERGANSAGGFCGGGSVAVSKSIGKAINQFNEELYSYLVK